MPKIEWELLVEKRAAEPSAGVRARVEAARSVQVARFGGTGPLTNADMTPRELEVHAVLDEAGEGLLKAAVRQLALSPRGYRRVLKLARTIAELARSERVAAAQVIEALPYRLRQASV